MTRNRLKWMAAWTLSAAAFYGAVEFSSAAQPDSNAAQQPDARTGQPKSPHTPATPAELDAADKLESVSIESPREARARKTIEAALDQEISIDFKDVPLEDAAKFFQKRLGFNLTLDQKALDAAGVAIDLPVTRKLDKISVRSALRLFLRQLDLVAIVEHESLVITSAEEAANRLQTRVYPVRDLFFDGEGLVEGSGDNLIDAITSSLQPASWDGVGGQGSIKGIENVGALVISQTAAVHEEVVQLLASLRKTRDRQGIKPNVSAKPGETKDGQPRRAFGSPGAQPSGVGHGTPVVG